MDRRTFLATALSAAPFGQAKPAPRAEIESKAAQWLKVDDVPSVAIASIEKGKLAWTAVYGEQRPGVPATPQTLYNVASLTKPVAAETILRLVSRGRIDLDEPMWPHWVDPDVAGNPWHKLLTPRLCLTHQTGFKNWRYETKNVLTFQWEPGTQAGYSGEGYNYVARFAEKKLGRPFEELAQEHVLGPIGMKETSFTDRPWHSGRVAQPHGPNVKLPHKAPSNWNAADLLHTTIGDYARFVLSVMRSQKVSKAVAEQRLVMTRSIAKPEDIAKVCAEAKLTSCEIQAGMGLGWQVLKLNGETIIQHGGADPGFRATAFFVPAKQSGVVVFTNGQEGRKVIREVTGVLHPNPILMQVV